MAVSPTEFSPAADFLPALLDLLQEGVVAYTPVTDARGEVVDFAFSYLNPSAQRILGLPAQPAVTHLEQFPASRTNGSLAFHRAAYLAGGAARQFELNYQADGYDNYFRVQGRRLGDKLLVAFTDTADHPRSAVEQALRASQAREAAAHAEIAAQQATMQHTLEQAPLAIAILDGPAHVITFANPSMGLLWGRPLASLFGRAHFEALPDLAGQGFEAIFADVYRTGQPYYLREQLVRIDRVGTGQLVPGYFHIVYQSLRDGQGTITGIIASAIEVTEQVLARQQVENLNEELAAINEELRATNEEFLTANTALTNAQRQLHELNEGLEARVRERTRALRHSQAGEQAAHAEVAVALREADRQRTLLQRILSQAPAYIATFSGPRHVYSFFNETFDQVLAQGRARVGEAIADLFPELVEQGMVAVLDGVYTTGQRVSLPEVKVVLRDPATQQERTSYVDVVYQQLRDDQGQPQGVLAFAVDTTVQVLARQQVEATAQQLQLLTDALPVLIGYLDTQERYQFNNGAYQTWFNQSPAALRGRAVRDIVGEAAYRAAKPYIDRALAGERLDFESRMPYREGFVKHIRTSYVPDVRAGEVVGFYTLVTDVTEPVLAREQVQNLNEELAAINEEMKATNEVLSETNHRLTRTNADLDNFIYTASHDLKQPIANIEGLLRLLEELLPEAARPDAQITPVLHRMQNSVERFTRTIGHLTDLSKLQAEFAEPASSVALKPVVEDVQRDLRPLLADTGAEITLDLADAAPVRLSEKNLRSILYNLLSNALKYRHPARPPRVRLSCARAGGQLLLRVHDNGLGLETWQQGRLFGLFQRLHTHVEGSGIGLYMVKKIVENAGGTLSVESQAGVGTTFTVALPVGE